MFVMVCNADTKVHFISWYRDEFGFFNQVITALYDDQIFQDK